MTHYDHDEEAPRMVVVDVDGPREGEGEGERLVDNAQRPGLNRMPTSRTRKALEVRYFGRELFPHRESMVRLDSNFLTQPSVRMARRFIPSVYSTNFDDTPYFDPHDSLSYGASPQLYRSEHNFPNSRAGSPPPPPVPAIPTSYSTPDIPIVELPGDESTMIDRPHLQRVATEPTIQRSVSSASSYIGASIRSSRKAPSYHEDPPFQEPLYRGPTRRESVRSVSLYRDSVDERYSSDEDSSDDEPHRGLEEPPLPVVEPLRLLPPPPPPPLSPSVQGTKFYMAVGTLCLINLLLAIESTSITVALPTIAQKIKLTAVQSFWLGTSSLLTATIIQPLFNALSQMFGRKAITMASITLLAIGSVLGGIAPNARLLLAGRSVQGLGSGGCLAMTYAFMTDLVSLKNRGKWFGIISISWGVGTILGPMIGGAFAEDKWQWIFWINLPFCGIAIITSFITLGLPSRFTPAFMGLGYFDWAGTIILGGSLTAILIAISWGGAVFGWGAPEVVVALFVGALGFAAFFIHLFISPAYSAALPLLRPSLFISSTSIGSYLLTITHGMVLYAVAYMLPIYHQVRGRTPVETAVALLPITLTVVPSAIIVGLVIAKMGQYHPFVWIGWIMMALGTGFFMALNTHTETADFILIFVPAGVGLGMVISALSYAAQTSAFSFDLPWAASTFAFCRTLGGAFGVAASSVAFQNEFKAQVTKSGEFAEKAKEWTEKLVAMVKEIDTFAGAEKEVLVDGLIDGLYRVWMLLCIISAISLVLSILMVKEKRVTPGYGHTALDQKPMPTPPPAGTERSDSVDSTPQMKHEDSAV